MWTQSSWSACHRFLSCGKETILSDIINSRELKILKRNLFIRKTTKINNIIHTTHKVAKQNKLTLSKTKYVWKLECSLLANPGWDWLLLRSSWKVMLEEGITIPRINSNMTSPQIRLILKINLWNREARVRFREIRNIWLFRFYSYWNRLSGSNLSF